MLKIYPRIVRHLRDEILMGQVVFYEPATGCDGISATANHGGFTTLMRIATALNIASGSIEKLSGQANAGNCVCTIGRDGWRLFLVPKTIGRDEVAQRIKSLLEIISSERIRILNFTHYNFIQGAFPAEDVAAILDVMHTYSSPDGPREILFDMDDRHIEAFLALLGAAEQRKRLDPEIGDTDGSKMQHSGEAPRSC